MSRRELELSGSFFELQIMGELKKKFPECIVLNDIELYCHSLKKNTQIDLIFISSKVCVVIEAKNWTGWLKGNHNDIQWTGKSRGKNVLTVISPVNQNKMHIRALRNAIRGLGIEPPVMNSLVCVPDGTNVLSDCKEVCGFSNISERIRLLEEDSRITLNKNAIKDICYKISTKR